MTKSFELKREGVEMFACVSSGLFCVALYLYLCITMVLNTFAVNHIFDTDSRDTTV